MDIMLITLPWLTFVAVVSMITKLEILEQAINSGLARELPGGSSHEKMLPQGRKSSPGLLNHPANAVPSGVMLLFFETKEEIKLVFILRQDYGGVHSNQIGFPGGRYEHSDKNLIATALRETEEEVGISYRQIRVLGKLTPLYISPSNYLVQPVVGVSYEPLQFTAEEKEVKEILTFSLSELMQPHVQGIGSFKSRGGLLIQAPCYTIDKYEIWGATAMILSEMLDIITPS